MLQIPDDALFAYLKINFARIWFNEVTVSHQFHNKINHQFAADFLNFQSTLKL